MCEWDFLSSQSSHFIIYKLEKSRYFGCLWKQCSLGRNCFSGFLHCKIHISGATSQNCFFFFNILILILLFPGLECHSCIHFPKAKLWQKWCREENFSLPEIFKEKQQEHGVGFLKLNGQKFTLLAWDWDRIPLVLGFSEFYLTPPNIFLKARIF